MDAAGSSVGGTGRVIQRVEGPAQTRQTQPGQPDRTRSDQGQRAERTEDRGQRTAGRARDQDRAEREWEASGKAE